MKEEVDCKVVDMERDYVAVKMYCNVVWMICLTPDTCLRNNVLVVKCILIAMRNVI